MEQSPTTRCCWCKTPLVRDAQKGIPWICSQPACWARIEPWTITQTERKKVVGYLFVPTPKQVQFFEQQRKTKYTLFGGAKAVAKSFALRWGAYRECARVPGLRVLLLRRTYGELEQSHLLDMPIDAERLKTWGAEYKSGSREFSLANGSLIRAGHCETDADVAKFLSSQWDLVIFDEIVTFHLKMFLLIASCARTTKESLIAEGGARVWAATNPGGRGAAWVKDFFIDHEADREKFPSYEPEKWDFIQGFLEDNPYMEPEYRATLENLPPVLRRQYLEGDWDAFEGMFFDWQAKKDGQPWHVADLGIAA